MSYPVENDARLIDVFGAKRMALLQGNEATAESTEQLLYMVQTLATEPGYQEHHGIFSRSLYRAIGQPLVAQVNPGDSFGFGSTIEDRALATVYGIKNEERRVFLPRRSLLPAVYEIDETIFVDRDMRAKVFKRFTPLYGNFVRELTAHIATDKGAYKNASEQEVQEALDTIAETVVYNDNVRAQAAL